MALLQNHSWVEISRSALLNNLRVHRNLLNSEVKLMAVVKSNAYGHDLVLSSQIAEKSGLVDWLGVASLGEALFLRQAKIKLPILVLSYYQPLVLKELVQGIRQNISFMLYELSALRALERAAILSGRPARVHLKIDTGMARLGLRGKLAYDFIKLIKQSSWLKLEGVATHLATAEAKQPGFLLQQLGNFSFFLEKAAPWLPANYWQHVACTAALTTVKASQFNLVRLGIGYYGLWPSPENEQVVKELHPSFKLKPALTWKTTVIELQHLPPKVTVGYGRTYTTARNILMALLPVGYWDGYRRSLSNRGVVLIRGQACPVIGRVCMNITMVDVTEVKNIRVGDEVVLLGRQGKAEVTAEQIATKSGTINYEVVTGINPLLPRRAVK